MTPVETTIVESGDSAFDFTLEHVPELPREEFEALLDDLVTAGYIERLVDRSDDSRDLYKGATGLDESRVRVMTDPIKQAILRVFIKNPKARFILFNTQAGKSRLSAEKLSQWQRETKKVVGFVILSNDRTLGDQTLESYLGRIGRPGTATSPPRGVFLLSSSNGRVNVQDILTYIDAYCFAPRYPMPLILALVNNQQIAKILQILAHLVVLRTHTTLSYAFLFDECDQTYPPVRDRLTPYLLENDAMLHELVFVSATDGPLLDNPDYPECANAFLEKSELSDEDKPFYKAYHSEGMVHKIVACPPRQSNNQIALALLRDQDAHWKEVIALPSGPYRRKIIINSNARGEDMRAFATDVLTLGYHALVFNQMGLSLYRQDEAPIRLRTKGVRFNELLFYVYKRFDLNTKPLIILGRKKVDRGLGFHYAPRRDATGTRTLEFEKCGPITVDAHEGLIWTDMFLGHIVDKGTAVQKAGRLAGIVAHCPQYPGTLTWWVEESTGKNVERHNLRVDEMNGLPGSHTALQAMTVAVATHPVPRVESTHLVSAEFASQREAHAWATLNIQWTHEDLRGGRPEPTNVSAVDAQGGRTAKTHMSSRGHRGDDRELIVNRDALLTSGDLTRWGGSTNGVQRVPCVPVLSGADLHYVIVYKRVWAV